MTSVNDTAVWHDRERWNAVTSLLGRIFTAYEGELVAVTEYAHELAGRIDSVNSFIQDNTASVCPSCPQVCCINRHGFYDRNDLIYICALGVTPHEYGDGLKDTDPCRFLFRDGCGLKRSVRPFRCNWYFCRRLTDHMEEGPPRPYRHFVNRFQEIVDLRRLMLDEFFRRLNPLVPQDEGCASPYHILLSSS